MAWFCARSTITFDKLWNGIINVFFRFLVARDAAIERQRPPLPGEGDLQHGPTRAQVGDVHQQGHVAPVSQHAAGRPVQMSVDRLRLPVATLEPAGEELIAPLGGGVALPVGLAGDLGEFGRIAGEHTLQQADRSVLGTAPRSGQESRDPLAQIAGETHEFWPFQAGADNARSRGRRDYSSWIGQNSCFSLAPYHSLASSPGPRSPMKPREQKRMERGLSRSIDLAWPLSIRF